MIENNIRELINKTQNWEELEVKINKQLENFENETIADIYHSYSPYSPLSNDMPPLEDFTSTYLRKMELYITIKVGAIMVEKYELANLIKECETKEKKRFELLTNDIYGDEEEINYINDYIKLIDTEFSIAFKNMMNNPTELPKHNDYYEEEEEED